MNQLKFYIHFSAPMSRGEAYRRLRLLNASGAEVALPFLELEEELWDRDSKRLTLFFDPGRIKRGLVPHNEVGVPMLAGQSYTLAIDSAWQDAAGKPLAKRFEKRFTATEPDRIAPELKSWRIAAPSSGTIKPLEVVFAEPMDSALLARMIAVEDSAGRAIEGFIAVDRDETRWLFTPAVAWKAGKYRLSADSALEDLAGNKIGKLFDVDVFDRVDKSARAKTVYLRFEIR